MKPSDNEIEMLAAGFAIHHKNGLIRFAHALLEKYASTRAIALDASTVVGEAQSEVAKLAEELGDLASDMAYEANQEMDQEKATRAAIIERGERALRRFADAAPQASAEDAVTAPADVAQLVAFIFDRFGRPGDAGALPDNVAAAVRRLERGIKAQADKDGGQQRAGNGKTREAVDYPRGGALNFDDAALAGAEGIRSQFNACMHRNECRAMLDRQRAAFDHPVFAFLLGEGPLHGVHFGDRHPSERGAYWWRKDLRAALSATQAEQGERKDG